MNKTILRIIGIFCIGIPVQPAIAGEMQEAIKKARLMTEQGQFKQAYQLLAPVSDDYAGEAEFDYLYGAVLVQLKQNTLATLALERALIMRPEHLATQQLLLKTYQQLKNFDMAIALEQKINSLSATPKTAATKTKPTESIYRFSGFLGMAVGYDDNLTTGPDNDFMTLPVVSELGDVYVGDSLVKDQDVFGSFSGGGRLDIKLPKNFSLNMGLYGNHRLNNSRHDEDMSLVNSWLGTSYKWDKNTFNISFKQQAIWLSEQHYQDQYSFLGQWSRSLFQSSLVSFYANGRLLKYKEATNLNANAYTLGAIFYQQLNTPFLPLLSFDLYGGENKVLDTDYQYLGYGNAGVRLGSRLTLAKNDSLYLNTNFEYRHYKQDNPFFLTARDDKRYGVTARYSHYFFNKQLDVSLQWTWQLNTSSLELYDYQRHFATLSAQWNF